MQRVLVPPVVLFVSHPLQRPPAVRIPWIFSVPGVVLCNKAMAQLQECEKCGKPGRRLGGHGGCCEGGRGRALLHQHLLQTKTA